MLLTRQKRPLKQHKINIYLVKVYLNNYIIKISIEKYKVENISGNRKYNEKTKRKEESQSKENKAPQGLYNEIRKQIEDLKAKVNELLKTFTPKTINNLPFILKKETSFNVWLNVVMNDFKSFSFEYMFDENLPRPEISADEDKRRMGFANLHNLSRLNPDYRKIICNLKTSLEIMNKIKNLKNPTTLSLKVAAKQQWNSASFTKKIENQQLTLFYVLKI